MERWPDVQALAGAPVADVVRAWVGLGYNRRALRLRECAVAVARDGWPTDSTSLRALPGVGPYTAAAVATFAFDEPVPAVDVNHARVVSRLVGRQDLSPAALGEQAQALLPADRPAAWNHALMDLGATVCRARAADCAGCPANARCHSAGRVQIAERTRGDVPAPRFEDTDRYVRGRVVAALADGTALPVEVGAERLERAIAALARDGLVVRDGARLRLLS